LGQRRLIGTSERNCRYRAFGRGSTAGPDRADERACDSLHRLLEGIAGALKVASLPRPGIDLERRVTTCIACHQRSIIDLHG
jgi:hypothetical protein